MSTEHDSYVKLNGSLTEFYGNVGQQVTNLEESLSTFENSFDEYTISLGKVASQAWKSSMQGSTGGFFGGVVEATIAGTQAYLVAESEGKGFEKAAKGYDAIADSITQTLNMIMGYRAIKIGDLKARGILTPDQLEKFGKTLGYSGGRLASTTANLNMPAALLTWGGQLGVLGKGEFPTSEESFNRVISHIVSLKNRMVVLGKKVLSGRITKAYEEGSGSSWNKEVGMGAAANGGGGGGGGVARPNLPGENPQHRFATDFLMSMMAESNAKIEERKTLLLQETEKGHKAWKEKQRPTNMMENVFNSLADMVTTGIGFYLGMVTFVFENVFNLPGFPTSFAMPRIAFAAVEVIDASADIAGVGAVAYIAETVKCNKDETLVKGECEKRAIEATKEAIKKASPDRWDEADRNIQNHINHYKATIDALNKTIGWWRDILKYGLIGLGVLGGVAVTGITIYAVSSGKRAKRAAHALI